MRAKVDQLLCTGCGLCVDICPDVFEMDNDVAYAEEDNLDFTNIDDAVEASESCPVEAITVVR
ncbi:MAG: ferredoxin [Clostridia bacterium]|nr:ferredoxin [Clostridia bacterium]